MIDRRKCDDILSQVITTLWTIRDHIAIEEPYADNVLLSAIMEIKESKSNILRMLPEKASDDKVQEAQV